MQNNSRWLCSYLWHRTDLVGSVSTSSKDYSRSVVISMSLVCKLQVHVVWPVVRTVHQVVLRCHDDEGLFKLLQQMLPESKYAVCPGISDYIERNIMLICHPVKYLRKTSIGDEILHCESVSCLLWHIPTDQRSTVPLTGNLISECEWHASQFPECACTLWVLSSACA